MTRTRNLSRRLLAAVRQLSIDTMSMEELYDIISDLFNRYNSTMLRKANQYVHNLSDAEDVVSNCWLILLRHAAKLEIMQPHKQTAYIMKCVGSVAIDHLRKKKRDKILLSKDGNETAIQLNAIGNVDLCEEIIQQESIAMFLFLLPPREQEVIRLRLENWSIADIATQMNISISSVRVYTARALKKLQAYMIQSAEEETVNNDE